MELADLALSKGAAILRTGSNPVIPTINSRYLYHRKDNHRHNNTKIIVDFLTDTKALKSEIAELRSEMEVVPEVMKQAIAQNASMAMDQEEYAARYNALAERYQNAADRYKAIEAECASRTSQRKKFSLLLRSG